MEEKLKTTATIALQTKNERGVKVRMRCASCKNLGYDRGGKMLCKKGYGHVTNSSLCLGGDDYEMKDQLKKVGTYSNARIKRKEYMLYALNYHEQYELMKEDYLKRRRMGEDVQEPVRKPISQIRFEYERATGHSIYI